MKVFIERERATKELQFSGRVGELLEELGINPETVVVVRNGEVVTEDEKISDNDEMKIISVVSGG